MGKPYKEIEFVEVAQVTIFSPDGVEVDSWDSGGDIVHSSVTEELTEQEMNTYFPGWTEQN